MSFDDELAALRAKHPGIDTVELVNIDLNGVARGKLIPLEFLDKLASGTMKMPASNPALDIFSDDVYESGLMAQTGDPDGICDAVPGTLGPMLWAETPSAQVQITIRTPDGSRAPYDPRAVLASVVEVAGNSGIRPVMALEQEFFIVDPTQPSPPLHPVTGERMAKGQVYDLDITRAFAPLLREITEAAQALGVPADTVLTEFGYGQFEINLAHQKDALAAADQIVQLRRAIKGVARARGLDASFMAKPWGDTTGSGLHLHLSLEDADGRNIFSAVEGEETALKLRQAVAGMLAYMSDSMLIFAPNLNSYRRLVPGMIAPTEALWALDHRAASVRVPETHGKGARIEHRVAGSDANPYLVAAAVLAAALAGIEAEKTPPEPVEGELRPGMGTGLPLDWSPAEQIFSASAFVEKWLGQRFQQVFGAVKRQEHRVLLSRITDVELDLYLRRF